MNPFMHPAVATPLEPDDVPLWRPGTSGTAPESGNGDTETRPVASPAGRHDGKVPGSMRVRTRYRAGQRSARRSQVRPDCAREQSRTHRAERSPACLPSAQPRFVWQPRLRSLVLVTALGLGICGLTVAQPAQVNANVATAAELEAIKGIGPKTARNIVSERQRSGLFESFQDFSERIRGIGTKRAASLRAAGLVIGPPQPQPQVAAPAGPGSGTGGAPVGVLVR